MSTLLPAKQIVVTKRQRKEIKKEALEELKNSIKENGLFHPPVVREGNILVAGERRLKAMMELHAEDITFLYDGKMVPSDFIPCTYLGDVDDVKAFEAELDENLRREDLSWQDRAAALADLHKLRVAQDPKQSYIDTGRELAETSALVPQVLAQEVSRALITADFLDDPDVRKAPDEKRAFNIISRKLRDEFTATLRTRTKSKHTFIHGDAAKSLRELDAAQFSCFIFDPPYGMGAHKFGDAADTGSHDYEDTFEIANELHDVLLKEAFRLGTEEAHLWLFCDIDGFHAWKEMAEEYGWIVNRTPIVWNSGTSGLIPDQNVSIRRNYELILFARKGKKGLAYILDDVVKINMKGTEGTGHAAQKPTELYETFLKLSAIPGDKVLDATCGSGTIFKAAEAYGVHAVGIEQNDNFAELCNTVLKELVAGSLEEEF